MDNRYKVKSDVVATTFTIESRSFFISNNGCIRRKVDAQHVVNFLTRNGYHEVEKPEEADILVFVSCAADDISEAVARESVLDLEKRRKPSAKLIVGGCLPRINEKFFLHLEGLAGVFPPRDMSQLDEFVPNVKIPFEMISEPTHISERIFECRGLRFRRKDFAKTKLKIEKTGAGEAPKKSIASEYEAFKKSSDIIRIAQGCLSKCSYCCIRSATGRLSSRPINAVISQCQRLWRSGQKRFTITAEDVGAYGIDIGTNVGELLDALSRMSNDLELAIMALNPRWVLPNLDAFAKVLGQRPMVKHVVAPIQAASDRLLTMMQRGHSVADIVKFFDVLEKYGHGLQIHTHLIIGFPGEKLSDVDQSIEFMQNFPKIHYYIYPYNDRPGTLSAQRNDKLSKEEIESRYNLVMQANRQLD